MSGCINSNPKDVVLLEMGDREGGNKGQTLSQAVPDGPSWRRHRLVTASLSVALLVMTALAISGFVMAAWSTSQLKKLDTLTSAVLVSSPNQAYDGYKIVANMFRGTGTWQQKPAMKYARADHGAVAQGATTYVFGGLSNTENGTNLVLNTLVSYNTVFNVTKELANMPGPRTRFGWALLNNKIYVFGGYDDPDTFSIATSTFIYDIASNIWTTGPNMQTTRTDICAGVVKGKIYAAGGYGADGNNIDQIEQFDPATNTWTIMPTKMSVARGDCVAAVTNDIMYIMGGTEQVQPEGIDCSVQWWFCYVFSNKVEAYNPATSSIKRVRDMLYERGDFGAAVNSDGFIVVAGGEHADNSTGAARQLAQPWVEVYNPNDDWWTPKAPLPEPRFRFPMVATADGVLHGYGGHPSCASVNQDGSENCITNGLDTVVAFEDVSYPGAYLLVREDATIQNSGARR